VAKEISIIPPPQLARIGFGGLPATITGAGERASNRFIEFFTANIYDRPSLRSWEQEASRRELTPSASGRAKASGLVPRWSRIS
jgi:hypothetical protein